MGLSSTEAIAKLVGIGSIEELRDLINQVDRSATGSVSVFYSGDAVGRQNFGVIARDMAAAQGDLRILDNTQVARFLDVNSNSDLSNALDRIVGGNPRFKGTPSYEFLNGLEDANGQRIADGIWDEVSARFAQETVGEVRVLTSPKKVFGVFALSELPVLLNNESVTSIDGLPRVQLAYLRDSQGIEMVKHAVAANAYAQIDISGLLSGGLDEYRHFDVAELENLLKDDAVRTALFDKMSSLDPESIVNLETGLSGLRQAGEISHLHGVSSALNKVAWVGGLLGFMLASSQASAAPTRQEAEAIMKQWAVDAAGSEAGSIVAGAAAGIAIAAFAAVATPVAAPVAIALTLGASMMGGFFGAEWANEFYAMLDSKDEQQRRQILDKLTELYFGSATEVNAETLPSMQSNFFRIDPSLSAEAILQAAKSSLAWRYALLKLNPFVVPNADYQALHNSNGELDLFDSTTRTGLSDGYLKARAEALHTYVGVFSAGEQIEPGRPYPGGYDIHFADPAVQGEWGTDGVVIDLHYTSDYKGQRLFGSAGDDLLSGSTADDMLFGYDGNDKLKGMGGVDYLEGGEGDDTYVAGDGDQILDHDGAGRVLFDNHLLFGGVLDNASGAYLSDDGRHLYTLLGKELQVLRTTDGTSLTVLNYENGDLGIALEDHGPPPVTQVQQTGTTGSEVINGGLDLGVTDYNQLNGYNLPDLIQGGAGRDWIYAWDNGPQTIENGVVINSAPDTDIVEGGPGKDFIHGGAGDDRLYATEVVDASAVKAGQGSMGYGGPTDDEGDFVSGQSGDDELYGSGRVDGLFGGDGDDLIYGGAGDDVIAGDWSAVVSTLSLDLSTYDYAWYAFDADGNRHLNLSAYSAGIGEDHIYAGDGDDLVWGGAANDIIHGQLGDDELNGDISGTDAQGNPDLPGQYHGNDHLSGGEGADAINGNGGSDFLFGGAGNDVLDGDFRLVIGDDATYHGDDYLDGGPGNDILTGNGGADILLGGDNEDALFGDLQGLDAIFHGADVLYGGAGDDQLVGQGGDDMLHGGDGEDIVYGDDLDHFILSGNDTLFGGAGSDQLSGGLGDDLLSGGEGRDDLWGGPGDDRLSGGRGLDYLEGGEGADIYLLAVGDSPQLGVEMEAIVESAGQGNRISFAKDVSPGSLNISLSGESGDLILEYADTDAVFVAGGLAGSVDTFSFGDSAPISYRKILSQHFPNAHYLGGGVGDDLVFGSGADDMLAGDAGDDRLVGGDGNDLLDGGRGTNRLVGGAGADTYLMPAIPDSAAQLFSRSDIYDSQDRSSVIRFAAGVEPSDLYLEFHGAEVVVSAGFQLMILFGGASGDLVDRFEFASGAVYSFQELKSLHSRAANPVDGSGGDDVLTGSAMNDAINGHGGEDRLSAGPGRDWLDGGAGADVMAGGTGYDTYIVDDAGDTVLELEAEGYDFVLTSVDYSLPEHVEGVEFTGGDPLSVTGNDQSNFIVGNRAANRLSGGAGHDRIDGRGGLDVIHGGTGDDWLEGTFQLFGGDGNDHLLTSTYVSNGSSPIYELAGGEGDDVYDIMQPQHPYEFGIIHEAPGEGEDTLILRADFLWLGDGLPENVENLRYEYSGELWFGADAVRLDGNALNNRIEIGRPNPAGGAFLSGLGGDDTLVGSDLNESGLVGGEGDDWLQGMGGNDVLEGGAGDDLLEGGSGADQLIGGPGLDTYVFAPGDSPASEMSVIDDADGASTIRFGGGIMPDDLSFEVLGQDMRVFYSVEDAFLVKGGADPGQVAEYVFSHVGFFTQEQIEQGLLENRAPFATGVVPAVTAHEGRDLTLALPMDLFTDPDGDVLNYRLWSADGATVPQWIDFDPTTFRLQVSAQDGDTGTHLLSMTATDPDGDSASLTFALNITDVLFTTGTDYDDMIRGTVAADNLNAGEGDDRLYGRAGDDSLIGGGGNDVLLGGWGDDRMVGGDGDDRYYLNSVGDEVIEQADAGIDRIYSSFDYRLADHLEELELLGNFDLEGVGNAADNRLYGNTGANVMDGGDGDDRLYGRAGNDRLIGGDGNDIVNGQAGDDEMIGGEGDDRYHIDSVGDSVFESESAGVDRVYSQLDHSLAEHFEELVLIGEQDLVAVGNAADNRLYGNTGSNRLLGDAGDDRLYGRGGDDRLLGGAGSDVLNGESGNDALLGGEGDDRIYGQAGDDLILAGPGNDRLAGGRGNDEYRFERGGGIDRIHNVWQADDREENDQLTFEGSVSADQVWFSKAGDDLLAQILGTHDQVRIVGWYTHDAARIDQITVGDGALIAADQVEQLVGAIAVFDIPPAAVIELLPVQREEYTAMVATYWQAPSTMAV